MVFFCAKFNLGGKNGSEFYEREGGHASGDLHGDCPMTISMLVNSLYNIIDSFYVAKISEQAMTALSLVYPAQNLLTAVTVGFAIGVNAVIAYYLGAGLKKLADTAATLGLIFNILHGFLIGTICIVGMPAFLGRFSSDSEIIHLGTQYANIVFLFGIPIGAGISYEKTFQAIGRMKVSMVRMLVGCVVNIILDPLMIFGFGPIPAMGIKGAAGLPASVRWCPW